jgi:hypothetical protein
LPEVSPELSLAPDSFYGSKLVRDRYQFSGLINLRQICRRFDVLADAELALVRPGSSQV